MGIRLCKCNEINNCFAKTVTKRCEILTSTYKKPGQCPFRKAGIADIATKRK